MWRVPTEDDLIASMSVAEIDAYKNSANWDSDPIQILLRRVAAWVRDQIRTNGNVKMSPEEYSIPEGCISYAMDMLVYDVCKRLGGSLSEERKSAKEAAEKYFERVSRRWVVVEGYGKPTDEASAGSAAVIVTAGHHRLTNENLENL